MSITNSSLTRSRFISIDALRGIAAFMVVLYHAFGGGTVFRMNADGELHGTQYLGLIPGFGYTGVYLFFVISGFCIHLRWAKARARDKSVDPQVDFLAFWRRRWIRLYPAYLAAMALYLLWQYSQGDLFKNGIFAWDLVSHLLMIHNLDVRTVYSMNGVFWTLAIEEQLYLLYFLLLWIRRRWGWTATIGLTFASRFLWLAVSLLVTKSTGFGLPFIEGSLANWWIWAMGAIAVERYFGLTEFPRWCSSRLLLITMLVTAGVVHLFMYSQSHGLVWFSMAFEPLFWGGAFFILINLATAREKAVPHRGVLHLGLAGCAFVGLFSYSLYLTHDLVLDTLAGRNAYALCLISLAFAYVFFLVFERPFMLYLAAKSHN